MSEFAGFDLDQSTARAWSRFQARLADHVIEMEDDDILIVEAESSVDETDDSGASPYVSFCAFDESLVRCEVPSNAELAAEHQLAQPGVATLLGLGWSAPTPHGEHEGGAAEPETFWVDVERSDADRLAVMAVKVLRDVFGVAHPVFLMADELPDHDDGSSGSDELAAATAVDADPDEPIAVVARDSEHLQQLVAEALTPFFEQTPEVDEDGDFPVVTERSLFFVRVLEAYPAIQMFAELVSEVADRERAAFEVAVLNRDVRFVKFVLIGDWVLAQILLPALPFAPKHLREMVALMAETVDRVSGDLVARVGGRPAGGTEDAAASADEENDTATVHPAMLTLLQLELAEPGSVDPVLAASICDMDRDLILGLISRTSAHESDDAARTVELLRRALRVVVESEAGREPSAG